MTKYYIEIIEHITENIVKKMGPFIKNKAEKIEDGVNINLNHDLYYTRLVKA